MLTAHQSPNATSVQVFLKSGLFAIGAKNEDKVYIASVNDWNLILEPIYTIESVAAKCIAYHMPVSK